MPRKLWDETTYPFPYLNGATVEVRKGKGGGGRTREDEAPSKPVQIIKKVRNRTQADSVHHSAITAMRVAFCLIWAVFEQTTPSANLCDGLEHSQNLTATITSMAISEHLAYHVWTITRQSFIPLLAPVATWAVSWSHNGGIRVEEALCNEGGMKI